MKKSELIFKCVVPSIAALNLIAIKVGHSRYDSDLPFFVFNGAHKASSATANSETFCVWPEPIMSYEEALKLIESIEPDAPEFDIKPFERILARGANGSEWLARLYEAKGTCNFIETGGCFCNQLIKYDGNEHLHRTANPAAGWWECENGKPIWRTK
jgi:hypothetical protein